jgi:hypothetical protein
MIKTLLGVLALQAAFGLILAVAIFMGNKADAKCKHPQAWKPLKSAPSWAPDRKCETR